MHSKFEFVQINFLKSLIFNDWELIMWCDKSNTYGNVFLKKQHNKQNVCQNPFLPRPYSYPCQLFKRHPYKITIHSTLSNVYVTGYQLNTCIVYTYSRWSGELEHFWKMMTEDNTMNFFEINLHLMISLTPLILMSVYLTFMWILKVSAYAIRLCTFSGLGKATLNGTKNFILSLSKVFFIAFSLWINIS